MGGRRGVKQGREYNEGLQLLIIMDSLSIQFYKAFSELKLVLIELD